MKNLYYLKVLVSITALLIVSCAKINIDNLQSSKTDIWFEDIQNSSVISISDGTNLVRAIAESVLNDNTTIDYMPEYLKNDFKPNIVFISVSNSKEPAIVFIGRGLGLENAINQALYSINDSIPADYNVRWVKLDIVKYVFHPQTIFLDKKIKINRSLQGIAFNRDTGIAFIPEELVSNTLVNGKRYLRTDKIVKYMAQRESKSILKDLLENKSPLTIHRFTTESYFYDGESVYPLYRGHRMFNDVSKDTLLNSVRLGGDYLKRSVRSDGSFIYLYLPKSDRIPDDYNILRHAGATYSMLEVYELTNDPELMEAIKRAISYLINSTKRCVEGGEELNCVVENDIVKLGGNALVALAVAKYIDITGDHELKDYLINLGRWIQRQQLNNGEFYPHIQRYSDGKASKTVSDYYPGEALFALTRIYDLYKDESLLNTAEKGAQYLINIRDRDKSLTELYPDHWLLYALNELYRYRPEPLYLNQAMRIALSIAQSQNIKPIYPDWYGSYYTPPRSTPTATRSEGLYAAYLLARYSSNSQEAKIFLKTLNRGVRFQLQTQFLPESILYLEDPQQSLGGFHASLTDYSIQIDYVQHNLSGILGLLKIMGELNQNNQISNDSNN